MAIKNKNNNIKIVKGNKYLGSVMIGNKCVLGKDLIPYYLDYPAVKTGTDFYIMINGIKQVSSPSTEGKLMVFIGDNVLIRTMGKAHYHNPRANVSNAGENVVGNVFSVDVQGIRIDRATEYAFKVKGNISFELFESTATPKINIPIQKDVGVESITFSYVESPYDNIYYNNNTSLENSTIKVTGDIAELSYGICIDDYSPDCVYKEGYKELAVNKNYTGVITNNNQCVITITSKKGQIASIVCPPVTYGIKSYRLYVEKSDYSRVQSSEPAYTRNYLGTDKITINTRENYTGIYFYEDDVIRMEADREDGYKLPTIGKIGDYASAVKSKKFTLTTHNELYLVAGEKGKQVRLSNPQLSTGEYAILEVTTEYSDINPIGRNPIIYVGDIVNIPLDPSYRIGTMQNRKPGVGIYSGSVELASISFTEKREIAVPNIDLLEIKLEQGAKRELMNNKRVGSILTFTKKGTKTSPVYGQVGIICSVEPVDGFGYENYFINAIQIEYYCKRYLADVIVSKYVYYNQKDVPSPFTFYHNGNMGISHDVLAGEYSISDDKTSVSMTITKYDDNYVSDLTNSVVVRADWILI